MIDWIGQVWIKIKSTRSKSGQKMQEVCQQGARELGAVYKGAVGDGCHSQRVS